MKMLKRMLCVLLCVCTVFACACSQKNISSIKVGNKEVEMFNEDFTAFWVSYQKRAYASDVISAYSDGWEHVVDPKTGMTAYDFLMSQVRESIKNYTAVVFLHDKEFGLELTNEQIAGINDLVSKIMQQENAKNKIAECNADEETLKLFYELMVKQNNLYDHIYNTGGVYKVQEMDKQNYFKTNYVIVDSIFFEFDTVNENGEELSSDDFMIRANQTRKQAGEVYEELKNGADFEEMKKLYNDDKETSEKYPSGIFVTNDTTFNVEFTTAAMSLPEGQVKDVEIPNRGVAIIKKLPMDPSVYITNEDTSLKIHNIICSQDMEKRISEIAKKVIIDDDKFKKIDPEKIKDFPYSLM